MTTKDTILSVGSKVELNEHRYEISRRIGGGGSSEVYSVLGNGGEFALKVFYPFYHKRLGRLDEKAVQSMFDVHSKECERQALLFHPNILSIHSHGFVKVRNSNANKLKLGTHRSLPFVLTEFVEGQELFEAIKSHRNSTTTVYSIIKNICSALTYMHNQGVLHADLKSSNILVRTSDNRPIIIDFGLAKLFDFNTTGSENGDTSLHADWDLFPQFSKDHPLKQMLEKQVGNRAELHALAFPMLDLYGFGLILEAIIPIISSSFEQPEREYLNLLASELKKWDVIAKWKIGELEEKVSRISPSRFTLAGIPELSPPNTTHRTIMVPPDFAVPLSRSIESIINNRSFRRLGSINQLGLLSLVYPGGDYKRLVHAYHSYELGRRLSEQLYNSPLFRYHFDEKATRQLLVSILLHDINHFPFLHTFQEARIDTLPDNLIDVFCDGSLTGERILGRPSIYELLAEFDIDRNRFQRLMFGSHREQTGPVDQVISSIINSGADVDKMSYLFLDSYFTGVKFGSGLDYAGLFKSATVRAISTGHLHLAFTSRALQSVEHLILTRYWQFKSLYWHHTNRSIMSMVLQVVRDLTDGNNLFFGEFLSASLWKTETEVAGWLDARYYDKFRHPSLLNDLPQNREKIYKRLYTVRADQNSEADIQLYVKLRNFNMRDEQQFRQQLAKALRIYFHKRGVAVDDIRDDEVLVDIPKREMDTGGNAYIAYDDGRVELLRDVSKEVDLVNSNFEQLTKRIRVFVAPRIDAMIGAELREKDRPLFQAMISEICTDLTPRSQIT